MENVVTFLFSSFFFFFNVEINRKDWGGLESLFLWTFSGVWTACDENVRRKVVFRWVFCVWGFVWLLMWKGECVQYWRNFCMQKIVIGKLSCLWAKIFWTFFMCICFDFWYCVVFKASVCFWRCLKFVFCLILVLSGVENGNVSIFEKVLFVFVCRG